MYSAGPISSNLQIDGAISIVNLTILAIICDLRENKEKKPEAHQPLEYSSRGFSAQNKDQ